LLEPTSDYNEAIGQFNLERLILIAAIEDGQSCPVGKLDGDGVVLDYFGFEDSAFKKVSELLGGVAIIIFSRNRRCASELEISFDGNIQFIFESHDHLVSADTNLLDHFSHQGREVSVLWDSVHRRY
jgi:hypothetical protein